MSCATSRREFALRTIFAWPGAGARFCFPIIGTRGRPECVLGHAGFALPCDPDSLKCLGWGGVSKSGPTLRTPRFEIIIFCCVQRFCEFPCYLLLVCFSSSAFGCGVGLAARTTFRQFRLNVSSEPHVDNPRNPSVETLDLASSRSFCNCMVIFIWTGALPGG